MFRCRDYRPAASAAHEICCFTDRRGYTSYFCRPITNFNVIFSSSSRTLPTINFSSCFMYHEAGLRKDYKETFNCGEQEAWVFRGGLTGELQVCMLRCAIQLHFLLFLVIRWRFSVSEAPVILVSEKSFHVLDITRYNFFVGLIFYKVLRKQRCLIKPTAGPHFSILPFNWSKANSACFPFH